MLSTYGCIIKQSKLWYKADKVDACHRKLYYGAKHIITADYVQRKLNCTLDY